MGSSEQAVIVGAGIAGLATAVALKRVGVRALVLEKSEGLRATGAALTLSPNAWRALAALGVSHKLTSVYSAVAKGSISDIASGEVQEVFYFKNNGKPDTYEFVPRPVHRKVLLEALAQELPVDSIRFSSKLIAIDQVEEQGGGSIVIVHLEDGNTIKSKVLIGCDGVHSVVAHWLGLAAPVHSGRFSFRGLAIYASGHGFDKGIQQFIDVGKRAGIVPLNNTDVYWFLTFTSPSKGDQNVTRDPKLIQKKLLENYARDFPFSFLDVVQHADLSSLTWAPLMLRYPWAIIFGNLSKGNVTVAGDAMHPMTPDLGQGGCSALEDAVILGRHIGKSFVRNGTLVATDIGRALDEYSNERRWRTAGLVFKSYISGWVQQGARNWWMKFLRDGIFYRYLDAIFSAVANFDCGNLPSVASRELGHPSIKNE